MTHPPPSWHYRLRAWITRPVTHELQKVRALMADVSALLLEVADGIDDLGQPVADLIASEAAARARVAELEAQVSGQAAEEVRESEAAVRTKTAFEGLRSRLVNDPAAPNPDPLPEPAPVEGGDDPVDFE